jgi:hypothetical protein
VLHALSPADGALQSVGRASSDSTGSTPASRQVDSDGAAAAAELAEAPGAEDISEGCPASGKQHSRRVYAALDAAWRAQPDKHFELAELIPGDKLDVNLGRLRQQLVATALGRDITRDSDGLAVNDALQEFGDAPCPDHWVAATVVVGLYRIDARSDHEHVGRGSGRGRGREVGHDRPPVVGTHRLVVSVDEEHKEKIAATVTEVETKIEELVAAKPKLRRIIQRALDAEGHEDSDMRRARRGYRRRTGPRRRQGAQWAQPSSIPIMVPLAAEDIVAKVGKTQVKRPASPSNSSAVWGQVLHEYGTKSGATIAAALPQIGDEIEIQLQCRPVATIQGEAQDSHIAAVREAKRWFASGVVDRPLWTRGTVVAHQAPVWHGGSSLVAIEPQDPDQDQDQNDVATIVMQLASEILPAKRRRSPQKRQREWDERQREEQAQRARDCGIDQARF